MSVLQARATVEGVGTGDDGGGEIKDTLHAFIKATPTIVGEAFLYILPLNFFLQRTDIAARRRSAAPSKVYQWLGPRCRQKVTGKNFANRPPNFYRGSKSEGKLASILKISRL